MQSPATCTFLLLMTGGILAQKAVSHSKGRCRAHFGYLHPQSHSWETKGISVSYIFTCALCSLFSSSCLINCFVSLSSFLLFLRALFAYERHGGKEKDNQSLSVALQISSELPQNHGAIETGTDPIPCPKKGELLQGAQAKGKHLCRNIYMHLLCWL